MILYRIKDVLKYIRIAFFISLFAIIAWFGIVIALRFAIPDAFFKDATILWLRAHVMLILLCVAGCLFAGLIGLRLVANLIENCSTSQKETDWGTHWLRDYCYKPVLDTDSDEIKQQKEEYNKIVKTMQIVYDSKKDTMTFTVKIANLQQKKIFDADKKDILDTVKEHYPQFQFDEYANNHMIGYSKN